MKQRVVTILARFIPGGGRAILSPDRAADRKWIEDVDVTPTAGFDVIRMALNDHGFAYAGPHPFSPNWFVFQRTVEEES